MPWIRQEIINGLYKIILLANDKIQDSWILLSILRGINLETENDKLKAREGARIASQDLTHTHKQNEKY